jgi:hypothetical protein
MNQKHPEVVFGDIKSRIQQEIRRTEHTFYAAVSWITEPDLLDELADLAARGRSVRLIVSTHEFNETWRFANLLRAGGEVYRFGSDDSNGRYFMHNKFCVIDYETVITGSFDFTPAAGENEENILILHNQDVAFRYTSQCMDLIRGASQLSMNPDQDIRIAFLTAGMLVEQGEQVKIVWKVEQAEKVYSPTLGYNLPFSGTHTMPVHADKVIELHAENGDQAKTATILIRVVRHPAIEFFRATESALVNSQRTTLQWKTKGAIRVELEADGRSMEVDPSGEMDFTPSKDTVYTLHAWGDREQLRRQVQVIVYPLPTFKTIPVPVPVHIQLDADLGLFQNRLEPGLRFDLDATALVQRVPKIDSLALREQTKPPSAQQIAGAFGMEMKDMVFPPSDKPVRFRGIKSALVKGLEQVFHNDPKALKILSQIKNSYEL